MNTAECVIEGHGIDIEATGRSVYIKIIHWCSFLFTLAVFYLLTSFIEHCRKEGWSEKTTGREHTNTTGRDRQKIRIKNTAKAIFYLGLLLSVLGLSQQLVLLLLFVNFYLEEVLLYKDIVPILVCIWFAMAFNTVIGLIPHIRKKLENYFPWLKTDSADRGEGMSCFSKPVAYTCAATTSFCSCWMLIGIMLNPTWGLTVTLMICFTFASFTYAVYEYLTLVSCKQDGVKPDKLHALLPGLLGFLAVIVLIPVIVFAGQSFNGRETADETLKTILVTALGSFISWLSWKRLLDKSQKSEEKQTQLPSSDPRRTPSDVVTDTDSRQFSFSDSSTSYTSSQNSLYHTCPCLCHPPVNDHNTAESQSSNDGSFIEKSQACCRMVLSGENIEFNEKQRNDIESKV